MTYGTGTSPGMQTLNDIAGITEFSANKQEPIDYKPRAPIVTPPTATLPPPGQSNPALAANWPNDPDEAAKNGNATASGGSGDTAYGRYDPVFRLPQQQASAGPSPTLERSFESGYDRAHSTPEQIEQSKKLYAQAKNVPLDENGVPIRRYLTQPKSEYLIPDPESPQEVTAQTKKKRGWKWPDLWPFD